MLGGGDTASAVTAVPDEHALADLNYGWGEAYRIGWDPRCRWWAQRRDNLGGDITAPDSGKLWEAIRADYQARRVPRVLPAEDRG